ncbi:Transglycosylase SLT domain 1 [uncultured Caudovirales phage]|uniref:Transglycosylase SLT domain 1 n=1 Tax=uncultured Caudovirales phage TaxID=2100421 RepID=A0A6J5NL09_9CAUD|nr:Transglycosylase SLT domain 1 [uncultured Caudovirales phage]
MIDLFLQAMCEMWFDTERLDMNMEARMHACAMREFVNEKSKVFDNVKGIEKHLKPFILHAMIYNESRWQPEVVKKAKNPQCGLMQIAPAYVSHTCEELKDSKLNIEIAIKEHLEKYKKYDFQTMLLRYAKGPNCQRYEAVEVCTDYNSKCEIVQLETDCWKSGKQYANKIKSVAKKLYNIHKKNMKDVSFKD